MIVMLFNLLQINGFEIPSLSVWVLAWVFSIIGLLSLIILVVYTRFGREISIKLSIVSLAFASVFIGFGIHFFLITFGI